MLKRSSLLAFALGCFAPAFAQPKPLLIDQIIAVVGREAILYSEMVSKNESMKQNDPEAGDMTCRVIEDLLYEKLLLEQANIDSVTVEDAQVETELDRRLNYFQQQIGGPTELEKFYGKSIAEIKADFRKQVKDQLLIRQMQDKVSSNIVMTPREVKRFFERIPEDSVPLIGAEVEYAMLLRIPKASEEEDRRVRRKMEEFREAVVKGEKEFCTVAILYSEDPASAKECGELGMVPTGVMVPEFDAVAMSLKEGEVSSVFKTQFGWHFMQMIERRGEQYSARHVLIRPQVSAADLQKQKLFLDSLSRVINAGSLDFGKACVDFSDDEESKGLNGQMMEPSGNSPRWAISELDQQTFFVLDKLEPGELSDSQVQVMRDGSKAYRILKLNKRTEPHRANLRDDYRLMQQAAEGEKRTLAVDKWIRTHIASTYVKVDEQFQGCAFTHPWLKATP